MADRLFDLRALLLLLLLLHLKSGVDAFGILSPTPQSSLHRLREKVPASAYASSAALAMTLTPDVAAVPAAGESPPTEMEKIDGISSPAILDLYDTFLLDMWGVMHNGSEPYEGVLKTVEDLKRAGKKLIVLSNSSKRRSNSERMLIKLGFDPSHFDNIITSGEVSHILLRNEADSLGCRNWDVISSLIEQNKRNVFVFGSGDEDESYCTSSGWKLSSVEEANLIVARGTFTINDGTTTISKQEDEAGYWRVMEESMLKASQRKLPMLVCNPDKVRPDEGLPPMPGAIGDTYERFLWTSHCPPAGEMTEEMARTYVKRIGKPFREVYDIALGEDSDRSGAVMVGDALETDVVGGCAAGVDVLWVLEDGIHATDARERGVGRLIEEFNKNTESYAYGRRVAPKFVTNHFRW